jgi:hypothetical protein
MRVKYTGGSRKSERNPSFAMIQARQVNGTIGPAFFDCRNNYQPAPTLFVTHLLATMRLLQEEKSG